MQEEFSLQCGIFIDHEQKSLFRLVLQIEDALKGILDVAPVDKIFAGVWAEMSR